MCVTIKGTIMYLPNIYFKPFFPFWIGYVWTKNSFPHEWWEIEVAIKVTGIGRLGGDGVVRKSLHIRSMF